MNALYKDKNHYGFIPHSSTFDYLPSKSRKADPVHIYTLNFHIVRVKISDYSCDPLLPNLDCSIDELKIPLCFALGY